MKWITRFAPFLRRCAMGWVFSISIAAASEAPRELVFLTWSDYIDPAVVAAFETHRGVRVKQVYFESDDDRDEILAENGPRGYDVILADGISVSNYARQGWLARIRDGDVPNRRHIEPRWRDAFPLTAEHGVPYFWGTIGIAYRRDLVPTPFSSWRQLFEPDEALRGKIVMIKHARDVIGMALKSLGHSQNSADPTAIAAAGELIRKQQPFVKAYSYVAITQESALVSGEIWAAMVFNGDAIMLREHNPNIAFVVPEEGSNLGVDYLTVSATTEAPDLAYAFIDFVTEPQNAAKIAEFVHYATPNTAARAHLSAEYFADPIIFPDAATLERCEFFTDLPAAASRQRNAVFQSVTQRVQKP